MSISAKEVNELRLKTGAGMMDCKSALIQSEGDFETAIEILRKRGQKISNKRSENETNEGAVFAKTNDAKDLGIIISLTCETDFVAKNDIFLDLGNNILNLALKEKPKNIDELLKLPCDNLTIEEKIIETIGKIGEKIEVKNLNLLHAPLVVSYIHTGNTLGVLVALKGGDQSKEKASEAGRNVAMQIAAMNPLALSQEGISEEIIKKEFEIAKEQAKLEGKPEIVTEKIAEGKMKKFFKENTLVDQSYIKDPSLSVGGYLNSVISGLTVKDFVRVAVK